MIELKGEVLRVDSAEVYELLKEQQEVRDLIYDGRTIRIDDLQVRLIDCTLICEDDVPEVLFEGIE